MMLEVITAAIGMVIAVLSLMARGRIVHSGLPNCLQQVCVIQSVKCLRKFMLIWIVGFDHKYINVRVKRLIV